MHKPVHVLAQGIRGEEGSHDYVNSLVRFECGSIGSFTASRITENKVRELQVTTDVASIQADYTRQELFVYQQSKLAPLGQESGGYVLDLTVDRVMVRHAEPLVREIEHFANCVRQKRTPLTDANSTLEVMRLAWWIQDKLEENDEAKS